MKRFLLLVLLVSACGGTSLDGGSAQISDGGTPTEVDGGSSGSTGTSTNALKGTVNGEPFTPKAIDIEYAQDTWSLVLYNQPRQCRMGSLPIGPETVIVTLRNIAPQAGTERVTNQKHQATFQTGLYMADAGDPIIDPAVSGTLTLDSWSEVVGAEITGSLELYGNNKSDIRGTFSARVCPKL